MSQGDWENVKAAVALEDMGGQSAYYTPDKKVDKSGVGVDVSYGDVDIALDKDEALATLQSTISEHQLDPNFPSSLIQRAAQILEDEKNGVTSEHHLRELLNEIKIEQDLLINDSPYPNVRAVIDNTDDTSLPCNTFRVWFLGLIFTILGTGLNQFFYYRQPGIVVSTFVAQLVAYPCGKFLERWLPTKKYKLFGREFSLNPGPFNQKEHILIAVMSNVSYGGANGTAYVTDVFVVQRLSIFFNQDSLGAKAGYQILLALSSQLIGYGCAGITRRFLVYPAQMIWPKALAQIALNKAMHHDEGRVTGAVKGPFGKMWTWSRSKFLLISFCAMFVYFWFPDYIFTAVSYFNWMTWIAPNSVVLALITGSIGGLGLNPWPTFDWNIASYLFDPIITPFFAVLNAGAGMFILGFTFIPAIYFTNTWNSGYLPINDNHVYDNTGSLFNVSRIITAEGILNETEYANYSPAYFCAGNAFLYGAFFAIYMATLSYVFLYHRAEVWNGMKSVIYWRRGARDHQNDVHNRLMQAYSEAPEWWYLALLAISIIFGIIGNEIYKTQMPVWAIFFGVALCLILQIPIGIINAVTNIEVTNNVIAEFVGGYALPGKPIAVMLFKTYGYIATAQSVQFSQDLKLGHYMKVPPKLMFSAQAIATIVGAFVSVGVADWEVVNIANLCQKDQSAHFTCPGTNTFFSAAVIWGLIGPRRIYGDGGIYHVLTWGFLVGILTPVPVYLLARKYPKSWVRYIHVPVFFYGCLNWAPYNFSYMWPSIMMGFVFNFWIKTRYEAWWNRYAYVLSSSWAVAIALAAIIIFFAVQFKSVDLSWWGNNIPYSGCDADECAYLPIPDSGSF